MSCRNNFHRGGTMGERGTQALIYTTGANKLFLKLRAHKFFLHYQLPREQIILRVHQEYTLHRPFLLQQGPTFLLKQGHTNPSFHSKGTQTLLQQGYINPSYYSKGTQTLPSSARVHTPFLLQQGHKNPPFCSKVHNPSFYSKGTQTLSFTARIHKPFLLKWAPASPTSAIRGTQSFVSQFF